MTRTTQPRREQALGDLAASSGVGTKTKFACDGSGSKPSARSSPREAFALLDHRGDVGRRPRARRARARPRASRRAPAPGVRAARRRCRARRADSRCARRRAPNAFENVRMTITPSSSSGTAVSPAYSKYASSTTSGRAAGSGREVAERVARAAAERQSRRVVADRRAGELGCDAEERIGRIRRHRHDVAGARERAGAQEDEVVAARAEHDVLRLDAGVGGDRLVDAGIAAVRIRVHVGERGGDRPGTRARQRQRRHVAVEADDLDRVEACAPRELLGRRRPLVRPEVGASCLTARPPARARACPRSPRAPRRSAARARARPRSAAARVTGFRNVSSPRPPTERAQPFVGSTWLPPVA